MNITSMIGKEVYQITLDKNGLQSNAQSSKSIEVNDEYLNTVEKKNVFAKETIPNKDVFEFSGSGGGTPDSAEVTRMAGSMSNRELYEILLGRECTIVGEGDIDLNDKHIQDIINVHINVSLGSGIEGGIPTKERIAEYYGNMAKRLDMAYGEGRFTDEEYSKLNEMMNQHMEHTTDCAERRTAERALGRARGSLSPQKAGEVIRHQQSITPEQWREERDSIIDDLVEKYYKIDRKSLWELFNAVRYGKSNN